jgi:outer membrane protein
VTLQRKKREFGEDLNQRRNEEMAAILERVNTVIKKYAQDEKYDLILQEAVYFSSHIDVTQKVIDRLNQ